MRVPTPGSILLALDTGSPKLSLALGRGGEILVERVADSRKAGEHLLDVLADALQEARIDRNQIGGIVALRGPGSFTGLRIGLATALALAESLAVPATALPTLRVLATSVLPALGQEPTAPTAVVVAAVDALRGDWFAQPFQEGVELEAPQRLPLDQLPTLGGTQPIQAAVGFGLPTSTGSHSAQGVRDLPAIEPPPLATVALHLIHKEPPEAWSPDLLTQPLYLRAPNIRVPAPRVPTARATH